MAPFIGLGRIEEVKAFVASRPASVFNDSEKMKGLILKSMTYYKKFYVPIV
jgi:hypothetical protein